MNTEYVIYRLKSQYLKPRGHKRGFFNSMTILNYKRLARFPHRMSQLLPFKEQTRPDTLFRAHAFELGSL